VSWKACLQSFSLFKKPLLLGPNEHMELAGLYGKDDGGVLCANTRIERARHVMPISESLNCIVT